ncbi:MAG: hypothetical protein WB443_04080, partial [Nitrososphaeraceae archaeon]
MVKIAVIIVTLTLFFTAALQKLGVDTLFGYGYVRTKYYFLAWSVGWFYSYMGLFRHYSRLILEEYMLRMVAYSFFYLLYG